MPREVAGCCQWCGKHLGNKPHPVVISVDGFVVQRAVLCITCKDELQDNLRKTWVRIYNLNADDGTLRALYASPLVTGGLV